MIRRLMLSNWRSYQDIDVAFNPGITFIVAPNGIGKTSLAEAAAWALFGESGQPPPNAVRVGSSSAVATAELELPDQRIMKIRRELPKQPFTPLPPPTVTLEGKSIDAARTKSELRQAYGADAAFLMRLTMPRGHGYLAPGSPPALGLYEHLCRMFDVDNLRSATEELDRRIEAQERLIKDATLQAAPSTMALAERTSQVERARSALTAATAAHATASERLRAACEESRSRQRFRDWQRAASAYDDAIAKLAREAESVVGLDALLPESVHAGLDAALVSAQAELDTLRVRQANLTGRATAIEEHSHEIAVAHRKCPACRQPMGTQTRKRAHSAHEGELTRMHAEIDSLCAREAHVQDTVARMRGFIDSLRAIPHPGPRPIAAIAPSQDRGPSVSELEGQLQAALDQLVNRRIALEKAEQDLKAAAEDEARHERLRDLYAKEAALRAHRAAIASTATQLVEQTIRPLTATLNARWQLVFPKRGELVAHPNGSVSRELSGERLPYSAFSTGERIRLTTWLRLLVLEKATKANFCWFDDPLEHLDPDARRQVAMGLARASSSGPFRQIIVGTYEESLARRLQESDPKNVSLIYVRQSSG